MPQGERQKRFDQGVDFEFLQIGMRVVPEESGGRMAIADMDGAGPRDHAFGERRGIGNDQIVIHQIEAFHGRRHEREPQLVIADAKRHLLQEGRMDVALIEPRAEILFVVKQRKNRRFGIYFLKHLEHALRPSVLDEKIMD